MRSITTAAVPDTSIAATITTNSVNTSARPSLRWVAHVDAEPVHREERGEDPDHEDLGVREVDEPQHAVDERVAQGDQCVDRPKREAVHGLAPEGVVQTLDADASEIDSRLP